MKFRTLFALVLGLAVIQAAPSTAASVPAPTVRPVSNPGITISQDVTTVVQTRLHSYGYTIKIDGLYGNQTTAVVRAWERANGLNEDGIAGPKVLASLGLVGGNQTTTAVVAAPATPKPAVRVTPPPAEPAPVVENGDPESIIRDVWPDDLEDHAVAIAMRESHLQPAVINANHNATGLFQIMWTVHRGWLCPQLGVCAQSDLQDARTNATAALALYERDGGWGPWKL